MRNSEGNQQLLEVLLAEGAAGDATTTRGPAAESDPVLLIRKKLESIIIPRVEFREATLREAVDFLKKKAVQLDPEPDAKKRGFAIVLRLNAGTPMSTVPAIPGLEGLPTAAGAVPAEPPESRITMSLANVPVGEALKYVANLSGCKLKVEPFAVAILPLESGASDLITKEWRLSDAMRAKVGLESGGDAKAQLSSKGIVFPEGATATWLSLTKRLVMKNTEENLEKIDKLLDGKPAGAPSTNPAAAPDGTTATP